MEVLQFRIMGNIFFWLSIIYSTPGQISANEALKQDLQGIISGLQEYLYGVKNEARRAQSDCMRLQRERDALQCLLQDKEQQLSQLQHEAVQISESTKEVTVEHLHIHWQTSFKYT